MAVETTLSPHQGGRFLAPMVLILFLALSVRVLYVAGTRVDFPIRGDINQYVLYAWNLEHRGVFSTALPQAAKVTPDSYRGPGYPFMLAIMMKLAGHSELPLRLRPNGRAILGFRSDTWMQYAFVLQIILGVATVWLAMLLCASWLGRGWALCVGLVVALWPHLISFTGVLLSETLFGFMLLLSLWLICKAERQASVTQMAAAGLSFGLTALVNPIILLFVPVLAVVLALRGQRKPGLILAAFFAIAPAAWAIRSAGIQGTGSLVRVEQNFVQGSWPQYHAAENSRFNNAISRRIMEAIRSEIDLMKASPSAGLEHVSERMSRAPGYYLSWYLLKKPYLLWDWGIRVGHGGIYFLPVKHSPFRKIPILAAVEATFKFFNPFFFTLALAGSAVAILLNIVWRRRQAFAALVLALFFIYVTMVHSVLQAEPRYSVPYRPEQVMLTVMTLAWLTRSVYARLNAKPKVAGGDDAADSGSRDPETVS